MLKKTNLPWEDEVSTDWLQGRIKYNYYLKGRIGWQGLKAEEFIDVGPYLVTGTDFSYGRVNWDSCYHISDERYEEAPDIHVKTGDLLVTKDGTIGKTAYIDDKPEKVSLNSHLLLMRPLNVDYSNRFLFWVINSPVFEKYYSYSQTGTIMASLSQEKISGFNYYMPVIAEQDAIANYLDDRCSKIDEIIAEATASIEEYKELKQAVIFEAVTKGLDKKSSDNKSLDWCDSGICHEWDVSQIRYLYRLRNERNEKPLEEVNLISLYTDKGVVQHADLEKTTGNKAVTADGYKMVYPEDIIVNIILCWMGAMGRCEYEGVTSPAYDIYEPIDKRRVSSRYYHYLFRTERFTGKCYTLGRGIMMMRWRTYSSEFRSIKVPVPPIDEQVAIADYLDKRIGEMDALISEKQALIDDLQAYKKSLIYEVVTGKRRVV